MLHMARATEPIFSGIWGCTKTIVMFSVLILKDITVN